jgi:SCY1-like protein 1
MDFLKFAVASAISKSSNFPATIGDKVDVEQSIWTLNNGTKRVTNPRTSDFVHMLNHFVG